MKALLYPSLVLLSLAACGGSVASSGDAGDAGGQDSAPIDAPFDMTPIFECPAKTPGTQLYGFCLTGLVAKDEGGGFVPQPPPGSECAMGAELHDVDLKTNKVHEEICLSTTPNQPYKLIKQDRTLTAQEVTDLEAALKVATVVSPGQCGADKSVVTLTVRTPNETVTYTDSFYSCQGNGPYAKGLDGILAVFIKLK